MCVKFFNLCHNEGSVNVKKKKYVLYMKKVLNAISRRGKCTLPARNGNRRFYWEKGFV
jgi:hypothetical protein